MDISCAMSCNEMAIKYKNECYSATIRKKSFVVVQFISCVHY